MTSNRLPWSLAAILALLSVCLAFEVYQLELFKHKFLLRDYLQQREMDQLQTQVVALKKRLGAPP
jgi:hypothetical protein